MRWQLHAPVALSVETDATLLIGKQLYRPVSETESSSSCP